MESTGARAVMSRGGPIFRRRPTLAAIACAPVVNRWPLVGRAEELELVEAVEAEGRLQGVVLSGQAGVGKTRLATEVLARAEARGDATAWVVGTRSVASVPFGAFAPLLAGGVSADQTPIDVLRGVADELARRAVHQRLVIGIDDAHLLDDGSAAVVHLLASRPRIFLVVTIRRGEPAPDPVVALWKEGLTDRVELQPLSALEVSQLLSEALGGQVDTATYHRLWEATRGNALYLRELVVEGRDRGALADRGGVWSWSGPLVGGARLSELVEARLGGVAAEDRALLEELAVGEPAGPALLGPGKAARLARLEEAGLVVAVEDGRRTEVRLSHPLYAEALRAGMGTLRRRAVCRSLASRLSTAGGHRRHDVLRLATWQVDGGGPADRVVLVEAAQRAKTLFDHPLAERLARRALEEGDSVDAHLVLGDTLYWQGRHQEAQPFLDAALALATDDRQLANASLSLSSNLFWGLGRADDAERLLGSVMPRLADPDWRDEVTAHRASICLFAGRADVALEMAATVLDRPAAGERARARALATAVPGWALAGRPETAIEAAKAGLAAAAAIAEEQPMLIAELLQGQVVALWLAGRIDEMEAMAGACYQAAAARGADDFLGPWALLLGRAALARGRAVTARDRLVEAAALLRRQDVGGFLPWCLAAGAQASALLGDVGAGQAALDEAHRIRVASVRIYDVDLLLGGAWLRAAGGELSAARSLARDAAAGAAAGGMASAELLALHDGLRLGAGDEVAATLVARASAVEGALGAAFTQHSRAWMDGDGAGLDGAAECFAGLGMPLLAAEAAAEAAEAYRKEGRASSQVAALSRSRVLAASCQGASTPALRVAGQAPQLHWLTRREREVAELAARGLTKREIAARLFLSIRTVGNHLNHAYTKLGVSSRSDLDRLRDLTVETGDGREEI